MDMMWILLSIGLGVVAALCGTALYFYWCENRQLRAAKQAAEEQQARIEAERVRLSADLTALQTRHEVELEAAERTHEAQLAALRESNAAEREATERTHEAQMAALRESNAAEREAERERRAKEEEAMRLKFGEMAQKILDDHAQRFRQSSHEGLDNLLKPLKEHIDTFRKRVEEIHSTEASQRGALQSELQRLMSLNMHLSAEAQNLTDALKGNSKTQGDWGEMLLETILDSSSLTKGIHYELQSNLKTEAGDNVRPDVILHLPENRSIVIDSKVSLTAYTDYTTAETAAERKQALDKHVASVRQHVVELGRKKYQELLNSPDFVIMFVANEPAFLEALKADNKIWSDAYDHKVILTSPTNLFAILKLVADMWKVNDQDKYTKEIAKCAQKLYDQMVAITTSVQNVGTALGKAKDAYDDAMKRLTAGNDNVLRLGERLHQTARLQSKRKPAAQLLESAGVDVDDEADMQD